MTGTPPVATVALAAVALLSFSACGGERAEPVTLPPLTATPTPSASSAPTPSPRNARRTPGQFDEATQAEAEAFVRGWWQQTSRALSGNLAEVEKLPEYFAPPCGACQRFYEQARAIAERGQSVRGARQRVVSLEFDTNAGQVALIDVVVISEEGELLDREGKVVQRYSGGKPIRWVAKVAPTAQAWEILDLLNFGPAAP